MSNSSSSDQTSRLVDKISDKICKSSETIESSPSKKPRTSAAAKVAAALAAPRPSGTGIGDRTLSAPPAAAVICGRDIPHVIDRQYDSGPRDNNCGWTEKCLRCGKILWEC